MTDCRFPKEQRLCSEKKIKELFSKGSSIFLYPFKIYFLNEPADGLPQVLVSVAKKRIRRANQRNLTKRRIREAYRLNRGAWLEALAQTGKTLPSHLALVYVADKPESFPFVQKKLITLLNRI